jgi:hypothetical protein
VRAGVSASADDHPEARRTSGPQGPAITPGITPVEFALRNLQMCLPQFVHWSWVSAVVMMIFGVGEFRGLGEGCLFVSGEIWFGWSRFVGACFRGGSLERWWAGWLLTRCR